MPAIFNLLKRNYGRDLLQRSRKLVSCYATIEKEYCHLRFNHACKREGVLLKSLRFLPPIKSRKGFQLARKSEWEFLNLQINESHKKIGRAKTLVEEIRFQLNSKLHPEDFNDLMNYSDYKKSEVRSKTDYIHYQKLKQLIPREQVLQQVLSFQFVISLNPVSLVYRIAYVCFVSMFPYLALFLARLAHY